MPLLRLIFDIETNGLDDASVVHCIVIKDADTGIAHSFADQLGYSPISEGLDYLETAEVLIGHNILTYDLPTLRRLYPGFDPKGRVIDTLVCSRLIWTDLENDDFRRKDRGVPFPPTLIGKHSLKAWGHRLGILKGLFAEETDWKQWSREMQTYCEQDVEVTSEFLKLIGSKNYSRIALDLEHEFRWVIHLQEKHGFRFDVEAARKLHAQLVGRREALAEELRKAFPPTFEEMKTPEYWEAYSIFGQLGVKATTKTALTAEIKRLGLKPRDFEIKPGPNKRKEIPFNPGSRLQVGERLKGLGWVPTVFTDGGQSKIGQPKIDDDILAALPYPQAKLLAEYFLVEKRIGQIADGDNAWLKLERNGRIHGSVITNGAITGRCTHFNPNVAQVPKVGSPYGAECRAMFCADPGMVMVGADAAGLELRCLSHYMARYDDGAYGKIVCEGDVHSANRDAAGFSPDKVGREKAKTFVYAFAYGAGDIKLGTIAGVTPEELAAYKADKKEWARVVAYQKRRQQPTDEQTIGYHFKGRALRANFLRGLPALAKLKDAVESAVESRGFLIGLDGRLLQIRSKHSSLNTLLQSAGAVLVKKATVILYDKLTKAGLRFGSEWAMLTHVHDEFQLQCRPELVDQVKAFAIDSFAEAGKFFNFRVPLKGEAKTGQNWKDTH